DSGYKSTGNAINEFIDNSIQAGAGRVDIIYTIDDQEISNIAVIDDGHGMEPDMIRAAVMWGGTHRPNNRDGFGRYGFGLPSAAVSITKVFEVYSLVKGGRWYKVRVNLKDITSGKLTNQAGQVISPGATPAELPSFVVNVLEGKPLEQGTVIVLL